LHPNDRVLRTSRFLLIVVEGASSGGTADLEGADVR